MKTKVCRICKGGNFKSVIDFGESPLVNSLIDKENLEKEEKTYPLEVVKCEKCGLVQTKDPIDTHEIYQAQDYLYYTGDMPQNSDYMKSFDSLVQSIRDNSAIDDLVVEIGSNDGTILGEVPSEYEDRRILGVDPATNVAIRAIREGVPTVIASFDKKVARNIKKEFGTARIIGGANCLAHIDDIHSVMEGVVELLDEDGIFWVECNYWGGMIAHSHYALIYHDHLSYFTLKNWIDLCKQYGLNVFDADITEAQGNGLSLRLFADRGRRKATSSLEMLIDEEETNGYNTQKKADEYADNVLAKAEALHNLIADLKENEGAIIAGYGAAAKGFSILHLAKITEKHIDYFVDDSPAKQGKFTPLNHIPVISRAEAEKRLPDFFFITAPNYAKLIMEKEEEFLKNGGKFILEDGSIIG